MSQEGNRQGEKNCQEQRAQRDTASIEEKWLGRLFEIALLQNGRKAAAYLLEECQKFGSNFAMRSGDVCDLQLGSDGSATGIILEDGTRYVLAFSSCTPPSKCFELILFEM